MNPSKQIENIKLQEREEYLEDMEMIQSPSYKKKIAESRASGEKIPAEQVWGL